MSATQKLRDTEFRHWIKLSKSDELLNNFACCCNKWLAFRYVGPFYKNFVLTTEFELLKPNRHFSEFVTQEVTVSMVTKLPFYIGFQDIIHSLCCLSNFTFLKSIQYIKSYGHLSVRC